MIRKPPQRNLASLKTRRQELRNGLTPTEAVLWNHLKAQQLGKKFRRQYSIGRYVVDFFCADCQLAVELDGARHFVELRMDYEAERTRFLEARGIEILRFENRLVYENLEAVLETIRQVIRRKSDK